MEGIVEASFLGWLRSVHGLHGRGNIAIGRFQALGMCGDCFPSLKGGIELWKLMPR